MPSLSRTTQTTVPRAVVPQRQLRDAVANGELELHYQPIIDLGTGRIHGAVQGMDSAGEVLRRLRKLGVGVALDDFGTGYSSLLYLRDLPITEVKIDRTFVAGVDRLDDDAAIVESVVRLARNVGLDVVAEGVETASQVSFLRQVGCSFAQGYLYAVPSPPAGVPMDAPADDLFDRKTAATGRSRVRRMSAPLPQPVRRRIASLSAEGASLHTIAAALNHDGMLTPSGTRWSAASVARALRDGAGSPAPTRRAALSKH